MSKRWGKRIAANDQYEAANDFGDYGWEERLWSQRWHVIRRARERHGIALTDAGVLDLSGRMDRRAMGDDLVLLGYRRGTPIWAMTLAGLDVPGVFDEEMRQLATVLPHGTWHVTFDPAVERFLHLHSGGHPAGIAWALARLVDKLAA